MNCIICETLVKKVLNTLVLELNYCPNCFHMYVPKNDLDVEAMHNIPEDNETIILYIIKNINEINPNIKKILIVHPDEMEFSSNVFEISSYTMDKEVTMLKICDLYNHSSLHECVIVYDVIDYSPLAMQLMEDLKKILQNDGQLYIHTKVSNMLRSRHFIFRDFIDRERVSFFSTNSFRRLVDINYLYLDDIITFHEDHRYIQHCVYSVSKVNSGQVSTSVVNALVEEIENDFYVPFTYSSYEIKYYLYKYTLQNWISQTRFTGYNVLSYHSEEFLEFFDIPSYLIDHRINELDTLEALTLDNPNLLILVFDIKKFIENIDTLWGSLIEKAGSRILNAYILMSV